MAEDSLLLTPSLLRAIEEHKYLQSCEQSREIGILEAIAQFREHFEARWLDDKVRTDNLEQVQEMQRHLWVQSERVGRGMDRTQSCAEWIVRHAGEWRRHRESLQGNAFQEITVTLPGPEVFGPQEFRLLVRSLPDHFCDVFVHQPGLRRLHFRLTSDSGMPPRGYLLLRHSHLEDLEGFDLRRGATLAFMAFGRDAAAALSFVARATQSASVGEAADAVTPSAPAG